jgi:hypothetical protein
MSIAESITGIAGKVLDKFVQDKDLKAKLDHELNMAFRDSNLAQIAVNLEEAKHPSLFVSGWRPFLGWALTGLFIYQIAIRDFIVMILKASGIEVDLGEADLSILTPILLGMLGLGSMRSYERIKNVARIK